jgi:predicted DNA-binding transcriptional regulator AlpA
MEYTIHDLERVVGYREECQRQISSIKQQVESLQNDLSHTESRWRHWCDTEDTLRREETLRRGGAALGEDTELRAQATEGEYLGAKDLEALTGTKASTWRYWASIGEGPESFKIGRRRVWKRSTVQAWLAEQKAHAHTDIVGPRTRRH